MMLKILILIHVCGAVVGLSSGFLSMTFRKGSGLHRVAGTFFFVSMLLMTAAGAIIAGFLRPNAANLVGSTLTFYLVTTAWVAARRKEGEVVVLDYIMLLGGLAIVSIAIRFALQSSNSRFFLIFGTIALLFVASDIRMLVRGGLFGLQRIARHLWRMCVALMFALLSFYPGQAKLFSKAVRDTGLLYLPHILLLGAIILYVVRVSRQRRRERRAVEVGVHLEKWSESWAK